MDQTKPEKNWKRFFDEHAPRYLENAFTGNTRAEVEFIASLFNLPAGSRILDIGCGTGRHSIGLAKAGYRVTGIDLSSGMLDQARKAAALARADVEWIEADATEYVSDLLVDAVICLCEGAFGLVEMDENPVGHDLAILRNAYASLRPNGFFLLNALNGYAMIRQMTDEHVESGQFDPSTMVALYQDEWKLPEGKRTMTIRERLFIPPEVVAMLTYVGFEVSSVWGGTAGEWHQNPLKLDEVEAMYFCRKL
ncbi:MAG TPA: methyltransferase domain-containing protein [Fimbriimonadaceae bacterium]